MPPARLEGSRYQVNVPLDDEALYLALVQLSLREQASIPEILRPVIAGFLRGKLREDPDLAAAVEHILRARRQTEAAQTAKSGLAEITDLPRARKAKSRESGAPPAG